MINTQKPSGKAGTGQHATTSGVLEAYGITRDTRGNPTQVDTTTSAGTTSALYTYDTVSRLRSECYPATGAVCTAKAPRNAYTYDLVGNRTTETARTVVGTKATTVATDYTYDAAYQLLTKSVAGTPTVTNTWSPNGALATATTPTGTQTYTTDLTDELTSLTLENGSTVGYTQDASGNRTSRTVNGLLDATWAWDDLSSLPMRIGEYDPAGTLTTGWLPDPTSSTGASLAQTSGGVSSWLLNDPFVNTVATVSTTGNTVSGTRTMDAFGAQRTTATGSLADASVGFAGQYLDTATGLYDMRARDYDPSSGRFTATDPVAVPTGMPYVAGYSYSYNNPLMFTDASGLLPLGDPRFRGKPTPLHAAVGSTVSGGSFSYTGYQDTTTVQYALITKSVDCERDVAVGFSDVNDYCAGLLKAAAIKDLHDRGGCSNAFAWYAENSDVITATAALIGIGFASQVAQRGISEGTMTAPGPKAASLSDAQARTWYLEQERAIAAYDAKLQAAGISPKIRAITAFNSRNTIRTQARAAMSNRPAAAKLEVTDPNLTWDQAFQKYGGNYDAIANGASRSRASTNQQFGLEP
jgi:RHS repeat-associated protein